MRILNLYGPPDGWSGVSGSSAGRTVICPSWLALPHAYSTGPWAERGNIIHEFCRKIGKNPSCRAQSLLNISDDDIRKTCEGIELEAVLDGIEVKGLEWAFALDVKERTVRFLGENIERKYAKAALAQGRPLGRFEIPLSIDVVGIVNGVPCELDYKSGRNLGGVEDNWQRRLCSAALIYHFESASAISRLAYINEDGSVYPDGCEFQLFEIEDFCDEQVEAIDRVWKAREVFANGDMPNVSESEECRYCPAKVHCPAWINFAKALAGKLETMEQPTALTLEELGVAWALWKKAEKVFEQVEKVGKAIATEETPLPIGEDKEVRPSWKKGKKFFDQAKARGELVIAWGKMGLSDEEIASKLESLNGQGADYQEYRTVNRKVKKAS